MGKAYNGTKFMLEAIKKAGTLDIPTIIKTWEGMRGGRYRAHDHAGRRPPGHDARPVAEMVKTTNEFYPFPYVENPP